jgi:transketolase
MAAAMNGVAVHRGLTPCGGSFLTFTGYCRPALRLSAFMGAGVIYVMTPDLIGLGEDRPTHQPIEHLASLRAMPGLYVLRPADAVETAECWGLALHRRDGPSVLALTRHALPLLRNGARLQGTDRNLCARGAYMLAKGPHARQVTLLATGSEVSIAIAAREILARDGIVAAVVSIPWWKLIEAQPPAYRTAVLGSAPRVAVEADVLFGWERWLGATRRLYRHDRVWRLRARRGAVPVFRHYR